eukprot:2256172-Rhodomonas_salina.5
MPGTDQVQCTVRDTRYATPDAQYLSGVRARAMPGTEMCAISGTPYAIPGTNELYAVRTHCPPLRDARH